MPLQLSSSRRNNHTFRLIYFAVVLPLLSMVLLAATLTFNGNNIVHGASAYSQAPSDTAFRIPTNTTWYFPEGSVGGGWQQYFTFLNTDPSLTSTVSITYILETSPVTRKTFTHSVGAH